MEGVLPAMATTRASGDDDGEEDGDEDGFGCASVAGEDACSQPGGEAGCRGGSRWCRR